jgi:hypothetical protein
MSSKPRITNPPGYRNHRDDALEITILLATATLATELLQSSISISAFSQGCQSSTLGFGTKRLRRFRFLASHSLLNATSGSTFVALRAGR